MKHLLILCCLFIVLPVFAQPLTREQSIDYVEKLGEIKMFSPKGKALLISQVDEMPEMSVEKMLFLCEEVFLYEAISRTIARKPERRKEVCAEALVEDSIPAEDPAVEKQNLFLLYSPQYCGALHPERSAFGKHRRRTARDLLNVGLIDSVVYRDVLAQLHRLDRESQVVEYAKKRVKHYQEYESNKAAQIRLFQRLREKQILSPEGYDALIASYQPFELKEKADVIPYCYRAIVPVFSSTNLRPEQYYPEVFRQVKAVFPAFDYTNLKISRFKGTYRGQDVVISFEVAGRKYSHRFGHEAASEADTTIYGISPEFYRGINKWLTDLQSPLRLCVVGKSAAHTEIRVAGLIFITAEQFDTWENWSWSELFGQENYDNTFTSDYIKKCLNDYERIGLFNHLSAEERIQVRQQAALCEIGSHQRLLMCIPRCVVDFNDFTDNMENPYEALPLLFAQASHGTFSPANIKEPFRQKRNGRTAEYGFECNGKVYSVAVLMRGRELDLEFIKLIEQAMGESTTDTRLYTCYGRGQTEKYVFLNRAQYKHLSELQPDLFTRDE